MMVAVKRRIIGNPLRLFHEGPRERKSKDVNQRKSLVAETDHSRSQPGAGWTTVADVLRVVDLYATRPYNAYPAERIAVRPKIPCHTYPPSLAL